MILKVGGAAWPPVGLFQTRPGSSATSSAYQELLNESLCKTHHYANWQSNWLIFSSNSSYWCMIHSFRVTFNFLRSPVPCAMQSWCSCFACLGFAGL